MQSRIGIGIVIFVAAGSSLLAQVKTGEVPGQPGTPQPAPAVPPGLPANVVPKATGERVPMISATGRTPAQIEAATKAAMKGKGAPEKSVLDDIEPQNAKLPYQELIKIARSDSTQPKDAQIYILKIASLLEGVKPDEISLFLDLPDVPMILPVSEDGFFQVPFSLDLHEKNPLLVANQPKGTLSISVQLELPKVDPPKVTDGKVRYKELFRPIVQMAEGMKKVDPQFGKDDQQQFALEIVTGEEPVVVKRALGSRTLRPNAEGKVYMVYERLLYEENPEIVVPDKITVNVRPVTAREAVMIRAQ